MSDDDLRIVSTWIERSGHTDAGLPPDAAYRIAGEIGRLRVERDRYRAGIQWVRGMCSDGEPLEAIDAKLGGILDG
jgi:hypothetical protein